MYIQSLIKSTSYIEFVCKLDNLINEILYSQNDGYYSTSSKVALQNALKTVDKFNFEAEKIARDYSFSEIEEILSQKRNEILFQVRKHYYKELYAWVYDVFNMVINNLLLKISINSNNNEIISKCRNDITEAVKWLCSSLNYNSEQMEEIINKLNTKIQKALESKDNDYISALNPKKSKYDIFLKLFDLINSDYSEFCEINFDDYKLKLSSEDMHYFKRIQAKLKHNKTEVLDKINLINYALNKLDFKNNEKQYEFIKQIIEKYSVSNDNSYDSFKEIVKTRYQIFNNKEEYYRNLLGA